MTASLHEETHRFKRWAASAYPEGPRSGEWECAYLDWPALYGAFASLVDGLCPANAGLDLIADLVYVLARDNECEYLISVLENRPAWLSFLLPHILAGDEPDAKWQAAKALGRAALAFDEAEAALLRLVDDPDEYVNRLALMALGELQSGHAERLAERAWQSGMEYRCMMALHVLHTLRSPKLATYVELARADEREHVRLAAERAQATAP